MKRICLLAAAVSALGVLIAPAAASAQVIELGATSTPLAAPSCPAGVTPANCRIVLTQVTALETIRDGKPRLLDFGVTNEQAWEVGLACGGKIQIFVERVE